DPKIEAAVPGLHVEDWDFAPLRRDHSKAAIGVAEQEQRFGTIVLKGLVSCNDDLADRFRAALAGCFQKEIGRADAELGKEDLVQLIVVVLTRMDECMLEMAVELLDDAGQPDDFRSRPDDRHDLKHGGPRAGYRVASTPL